MLMRAEKSEPKGVLGHQMSSSLKYKWLLRKLANNYLAYLEKEVQPHVGVAFCCLSWTFTILFMEPNDNIINGAELVLPPSLYNHLTLPHCWTLMSPGLWYLQIYLIYTNELTSSMVSLVESGKYHHYMLLDRISSYGPQLPCLKNKGLIF